MRYIKNGRPITGNYYKNATRLFCVRRRGWLFEDIIEGGNASSTLYTRVGGAMGTASLAAA